MKYIKRFGVFEFFDRSSSNPGDLDQEDRKWIKNITPEISKNMDEIYHLSPEYNGIVYLYNQKYPSVQYWFFIEQKFDTVEQNNDYFRSIWQIRNIAGYIADICTEYMGAVHSTTTLYNNSIVDFGTDLSTYGLVGDDISINMDDMITIAAGLKKHNINRVGAKKIKLHFSGSHPTNVIRYDSENKDNNNNIIGSIEFNGETIEQYF